MSDGELVRAATYVNRFEADIAKAALEAAGVPVLVKADDCGGMRPHLWMGGVDLLVPAADAERAAEVLAGAEADLDVDENDGEPTI